MIKENKKPLIITSLAIILLFIASFVGYFYYDVKGAGIFSMVVSIICVYFCLNKAFQESYILVEDNGFLVKKGKKEGKFYFRDIESINTKITDSKKGHKIIVIKFKKRKGDMELVEKLLQRLGNNEATILTKYEKTIDEIYEILKEKFNKFNEKKINKIKH